MTDTGIRTTHTGSLPRPERVQELLRQDEPLPEDAVTAAVEHAVRKQAEAGIDVANNGEQARLAYSVGVTDRLTGFGEDFADRDLPADLADFPNFAEELFDGIDHIGGPVAEGPIDYVGGDALGRELDRFDAAVDATDARFRDRFFTAPSPGAVLRFTDSAHHDSVEDYLFALADALREEYRIIADHGLQLQIDAPELLAAFTITFRDDTPEEFREHVETYIAAINRALADVPADRVRMHACWGNYPGPHHHDIDLEAVLDLFYDADVSGLIVEAANPRHGHTHEAFAEHPLPADWTLVPGVIDVKTNIVEHPRTVADRIQRFAAATDRDRVMAGTDCGFETVMGANFVHPAIAWRKLAALRDGADRATERLF